MKFVYKARDKQSKEQKGIIEASSKKEALQLLEKHNFFVTSLKPESSGIFSKKLDLSIFISSKDIVIFTRQFSIMLKSAIPPLEALKSQIGQTKNPQFRDKIVNMAEIVETGGSLSRAFS
ncbi:MAG: type II secretion system F family protein, partial [Parcubacteria group bacterium]|nr:type II secretion system F family protein [Parcubacteria group bacterium]